jgi:hypothetical protein
MTHQHLEAAIALAVTWQTIHGKEVVLLFTVSSVGMMVNKLGDAAG